MLFRKRPPIASPWDEVTHLGLAMALLRGSRSPSAWSRFLLRAFSLERVIVLGAALALLGLLIDIRVLVYWLAGQFVTFSHGMTILGILGTTLILMGGQVIVGGLFMAALLMARSGGEG